MTKAELIEKIVRSRDLPPDITKKCVGQILDVAFAELASYFIRAKVTRTQSPRFTFPGFGTFTKKKRSARKGVNPRTLEPMTIDAAFTIDFRPGTELRAGLNGITSKPAPARRAPTQTSAQLELEHPFFDGSAEDDEAALAAEDEALILRRRFTAREDLDDASDLEDDDVFEDLAERRGSTLDDYELPPAPMQRATPPGGRTMRFGSR